MKLISSIEQVQVHQFDSNGHAFINISAIGTVNSTGWSDVFLSPRYYVVPPSDGIWEFDFYGDPPSGQVLWVNLPVADNQNFGKPDWAKGVRVYAASNSMESEILTPEPGGPKLGPVLFDKGSEQELALENLETRARVIVKERLAVFDDSFNIIGHCGGLSVRMKKLRHELTLIVEGPNEADIRRCIERSAGAGLIAAIVAVYLTGGAALHAAIGAFTASLESCLSDEFHIKIEDKTRWIKWCT
ncbi:MAG TPA: hypothetical protein DG048_05535 [Pseudoalteromonas sp.]|jgi:hypothetical protein|nr:hypothetical protein [Alteromonas macleodii]HCV02088.1 hypothetical protein [Pseudoalteromonas sp.]|tara:strand:+ start:1605 stop:2336 length:732 start_codon:yes stop_codon:yes gene_type:complete